MRSGKNILILIAAFFGLILLSNLFQGYTDSLKYQEISFSGFLEQVKAGNVKSVEIVGPIIKGTYNSGNAGFSTYKAEYPNLVPELMAKKVDVIAKTDDNVLLAILVNSIPVLLIFAGLFYLSRQVSGAAGKGGGALGFGKSKAKLLDTTKKKILFTDVAGVEEAKEELQEMVDFLKNPKKFGLLGGKIPKGCLLVGSPGTGKTLLARAVAGEANVPFFSISGSDFVEMFVGVGASRVRDLFEQGKKNAPCLIFIDEIDAVGRKRGSGVGGGNDEREQTLNQLLVEMDGFEANEGIIIIAATNRPDVLDTALLRPGRFDRQVVVGLPDLKGREEILNVHLKNIQLAPDVNPNIIARGTPGFTGADLANLVNEAALLSARRDKKVVTMSELEEAKDKVMMGSERKSMIISDEEKKLTAYHEAGHALVSIHCSESDPIHKATIIPRGRALGMVMRLPENDRVSYTFGKANADIAVSMGGRVAEEIIFGANKVTSGASSDIKHATSLARSMVTEWGMSDKLGPILYSHTPEESYLGAGIGRAKDISIDTANLIDLEIKKFIDQGYNLAKDIITKNINQLEAIAQALLEYETLTGQEIKDLIDGKNIKKNDKTKPGPKKPVRSSLGVVDLAIDGIKDPAVTEVKVKEKKPRKKKSKDSNSGGAVEPEAV